MGTQLIAQAHGVAANICRTHAARLVLQRMCLQALDPPRSGSSRYFAGSDVLAMALGYAPDDPAGQRAVRRALAELVDLGLVTQLDGTARRHHRTWVITLPELPGVTPLPSRDETTDDATDAAVENPVDNVATPTGERTPVSSRERTPVSSQCGHIRPVTPDTGVRSQRTYMSALEEQQEEQQEEELGTKREDNHHRLQLHQTARTATR